MTQTTGNTGRSLETVKDLDRETVSAIINAVGYSEHSGSDCAYQVTLNIGDIRFDSVEIVAETAKSMKRAESSLAMLAAEGSRPIQRLCGRMGIECNA
jgi:hypothetical protein